MDRWFWQSHESRQVSWDKPTEPETEALFWWMFKSMDCVSPWHRPHPASPRQPKIQRSHGRQCHPLLTTSLPSTRASATHC